MFAQGALIEPPLPEVRTGGRPEKHPRRAVVDATFYVVRTGCAWRRQPGDFPPWQTVYWYVNQWEQAKVTERRSCRWSGGSCAWPRDAQPSRVSD